MTPEQEIARAHQAQALLDDPLLIEAFTTIEQEIINTWTASPSRDESGREKLWLMQQMLRRVKAHLESVVQSGTLAKATVKMRLGRDTTPL